MQFEFFYFCHIVAEPEDDQIIKQGTHQEI